MTRHELRARAEHKTQPPAGQAARDTSVYKRPASRAPPRAVADWSTCPLPH